MTRKQESAKASQEGTEHEEVEVNQGVNGAQGNASEAVSELEVLKKELAETKDRYVRLMADFENFKKRALKEQSELLKYQGERLVVDLLEVLDNLELALSYSSADADKLKAGLEMTHKLFVEKLGRWEIRGEAGMGHAFDPQKHQAISRVTSGDAKPGTIVGELKRAYFYKDKLIRVGEVVVTVSPDEASA